MKQPITVLAPTGTLGAGWWDDAFERGMSLKPDVIAVDAGSTDPGPFHLGSGKPLYSSKAIRKQISTLVVAARRAGIPLVIGSAGGAGVAVQVDDIVDTVKSIAAEEGLHFKLGRVYADIPKNRIRQAIAANEIRDFEAGLPLTVDAIEASTGIVAQMGFEPIAEALEAGADVVVAGRSCDDMAISAYAQWRGGDAGLAIHMGKILECGAFCAEPFAMDVMLGELHVDHFMLEPGSLNRRASVRSVAAHSLYERENPFLEKGPGVSIDLSGCDFHQADHRRVRVSGAKLMREADYWVKLEGARPSGFRSISIAGVRCPTMIACIDRILEDKRQEVIEAFAPAAIHPLFHVYGRNGVMGALEPVKTIASHELGIVIEVTAATQELAHDACHFIGGHLLHAWYPGQKNTSGNLALLYSPRSQDMGPSYEFSAYHLMKATSPTELFPVHVERV